MKRIIQIVTEKSEGKAVARFGNTFSDWLGI